MSPQRSPLTMFARICLIIVLFLITFPTAPAYGEAQAAAFSTHWLWLTNEDAQEPSLVSDSKNGLHAVFNTLLSDNNSQYPSYYAYCPSGCSNKANWSYVNLGEMGMSGGGQSIALTPEGNPRVIWYYYNLVGRAKYYYAECDGNCGVPTNWRIAPILDSYWYTDSKHHLAIDPQGVAHFIYSDSYNYPHNGTFYTSCASNCTIPANWSEVKIDDGSISTVDLKFDPAGHPRLALLSSGTDLLYVECNTGCDNIDNWVGTPVIMIGSGSTSFSLEMTSTGKPRLAFYINESLSYAWCNTGCLTSSNWRINGLGLPKNYGLDADLELDSHDRPVISYQVYALTDGDGLHYSNCTVGCETSSPSWNHQVVETDDQVQAANPLPNPTGCQFNSWLNVGVKATLALDASDVPQFAYEAHNNAVCNGKVNLTIKGVRFATAGDSKPILNKYNYLPAIRQ